MRPKGELGMIGAFVGRDPFDMADNVFGLFGLDTNIHGAVDSFYDWTGENVGKPMTQWAESTGDFLWGNDSETPRVSDE